MSNKTIYVAGYWSGLCAFSATLAFVVVQMMQLFRVIHFPLDEILIYGTSLLIVVPFLMEILAFHHVTPSDKKYWSHGALMFSIIYAVFVTANYVVQLATVIPAKVSGTVAEIQVLEQTPHSMFWNYDAIGYICMGFAMLVAMPAFDKKGFQGGVRRAFLANALVTPLIAFVYFYPTFSEGLLMLGLPWAITAPLAMLILAIYFRKEVKKERDSP